MALFSTMIAVGKTLGATAPFLRIFIPLIAVVGTGVLGYLGVKGVAKRDTWLLARRGGGPVKGGWAVVLGALYLAIGLMLAATLTPFSIGLISA